MPSEDLKSGNCTPALYRSGLKMDRAKTRIWILIIQIPTSLQNVGICKNQEKVAANSLVLHVTIM